MSLEEKIKTVICRPQLAALATVTEGDRPWVRYVMTVADKDMVLRCATFVEARKVAQVEKNPSVHLTCGITDPMKMDPYVQIEAEAVCTTDEQVRHAFWNPMLSKIFEGPDDPKFAVLEMRPTRIEYNEPPSMTAEIWEPGC